MSKVVEAFSSSGVRPSRISSKTCSSSLEVESSRSSRCCRRLKQRCWQFHVTGITGDVGDTQGLLYLYARGRPQYNMLWDWACCTTLTIIIQDLKRRVVVTYRYVGQKPRSFVLSRLCIPRLPRMLCFTARVHTRYMERYHTCRIG